MPDSIRVADAARSDYSSARNCAESVLRAVQAEVALPGVHPSAGSGFTSGIGNTGCVCGALAGGVMMLGAYAETEELAPEARRLRAESLSAEFLRRFTERWGATCCRSIKRGQVPGSAEAASHCAEITEHAAALTLEIIEGARGGTPRRFGPRDITAMAERLSIGVLAGASVGLLVALGVASSGPRAASPVWLCALVGIAVALAAERGARDLRLARRVLGAAGLAAAALSAVAAAFGGPTAAVALGRVLSDRGALAPVGIALVVLASVRGYELFRYR